MCMMDGLFIHLFHSRDLEQFIVIIVSSKVYIILQILMVFFLLSYRQKTVLDHIWIKKKEQLNNRTAIIHINIMNAE